MQGLYNSSSQYNFIFTTYAGLYNSSLQYNFIFTIYMRGLYKSSFQYNFVFTIYAGSVQEFITVQFCLSLLARPVQQFVTVYFQNEIFVNEILYYIFKAFFLIFFMHAFTLHTRLSYQYSREFLNLIWEKVQNHDFTKKMKGWNFENKTHIL